MKLYQKSSLLILAVAAIFPVARAADAPPAVDKPSEQQHVGHGNMWAELGLNPDQKAKVRLIRDDEHTQVDTVKADSSLSQEVRRTKIKEIRAAHAAQIRALLTPDQQTKFDELKAKAKDRRKE